jgi:exodeoxyribonuclease-5
MFNLDSELGPSHKFKNDIKVDDNQMILSNGKIITLNDEQYEGINKIRAWLKNKNSKFFTLSGFAGVGKSTCIKKIVDEYRFGICVSAPTHKACKIIYKFTRKQSQTLHSLLGLRPDLEISSYNPNDPSFAPIALPRIGDYSLCIIDECSMINSELFNLIIEQLKKTKTKVLFMGDRAQLPPINQTISPVFISEDIEKYHLSKVERQKDDNPLLFLYDNLRNSLTDISGNFERKTNINDNGDGVIFTINKKEFRKLVLEKFKSEEFKKDFDYVKGLAWKNNTVMISNKIIRDELFGCDVDIIEKNDLITGYRTILNDKQNIIIIQNSADYIVVEKSSLIENSYGIQGFEVKIREEIDNKQFKFQDIFIVDVNNHNNLHLFGQMHDFLRDQAKSNKKLWKRYYEFRRSNILMKDIDKYINGQYRNNYDVIKKDIDYGYFITIHKAQGSTYQNVVINEIDINLNQDIVERNKLRYVALSRPSNTAIILTTKIDS